LHTNINVVNKHLPGQEIRPLSTLSFLKPNLHLLIPPKMEYLEETLKAAVTNGDISGVVLACTNTTGSFQFVRRAVVRRL
jgi:hypothetical protein